MNPEILERLLMDRALGALPPDTQALLTAYLAHDSAAAAKARQFDTAVAAARQVLCQQTPVALPPFPAARIRRLEKARRPLMWARNGAALAASLVIGVGLGARLFAPSPPPSPAPASLLARVAGGPGTPGLTAQAGGFWSASRLYVGTRAAGNPDAPRLTWDSPITKPRLRGEL